jgi:hypothetical protein
MARRDTTTGAVLEQMVLPALKRGGYTCSTQVNIGDRLGGGRHFVDVVAEMDRRRCLVSMKWQQVSGTAEQKVPFEVISLAEAVLSGEYTTAYLVLGGEGWKLRDFYVSRGLNKHLVYAEKVTIMTLEHFIARANSGSL